jgi:hypothetical protein
MRIVDTGAHDSSVRLYIARADRTFGPRKNADKPVWSATSH